MSDVVSPRAFFRKYTHESVLACWSELVCRWVGVNVLCCLGVYGVDRGAIVCDDCWVAGTTEKFGNKMRDI